MWCLTLSCSLAAALKSASRTACISHKVFRLACVAAPEPSQAYPHTTPMLHLQWPVFQLCRRSRPHHAACGFACAAAVLQLCCRPSTKPTAFCNCCPSHNHTILFVSCGLINTTHLMTCFALCCSCAAAAAPGQPLAAAVQHCKGRHQPGYPHAQGGKGGRFVVGGTLWAVGDLWCVLHHCCDCMNAPVPFSSLFCRWHCQHHAVGARAVWLGVCIGIMS
jgi:hypothetical protein